MHFVFARQIDSYMRRERRTNLIDKEVVQYVVASLSDY